VRDVDGRQLVVLVHVDDLVLSGSVKDITKLTKDLQSIFALTTGPILINNDDECSMLGRTIRKTAFGFSLSGDTSLIDKSVLELGLLKAKPAPTPLSSASTSCADDDTVLDENTHRLYRVHVGRLLYIAADRFDISYASKTLARSLHSPTLKDFKSMKHVYRYLLGRPSLPIHFSGTKPPSELNVYCDSDWASCSRTRRSTSGGLITSDLSILHFWSRTQSTVALSSAEAELTSAVTASGEALYLQKVWGCLGVKVRVDLYIDSKACIDHLRKLGLGKLKHIQIRSHYLQQLIRDKFVYIFKIPGEDNVSDLLTKAVSTKVLKTLLSSSLINVDVSLYPFILRNDVDVSTVAWDVPTSDDADRRLMAVLM